MEDTNHERHEPATTAVRKSIGGDEGQHSEQGSPKRRKVVTKDGEIVADSDDQKTDEDEDEDPPLNTSAHGKESGHVDEASTLVQNFLSGRKEKIDLNKFDLPSFVQQNQFSLSFPEKLMLMLAFVEGRQRSASEDRKSPTLPELEEKASCSSRQVEDSQKCVHWNDDGTAFIIRNQKELVKNIVPLFFCSTKKFKSLTRKLYRWGFRLLRPSELKSENSEPAKPNRRRNCSEDDMVFQHDYFQRDKKELMSRMRSITTRGSQQTSESKMRNSDSKDGNKKEIVATSAQTLSNHGMRTDHVDRVALEAKSFTLRQTLLHRERDAALLGISDAGLCNSDIVAASLMDPQLQSRKLLAGSGLSNPGNGFIGTSLHPLVLSNRRASMPTRLPDVANNAGLDLTTENISSSKSAIACILEERQRLDRQIKAEQATKHALQALQASKGNPVQRHIAQALSLSLAETATPRQPTLSSGFTSSSLEDEETKRQFLFLQQLRGSHLGQLAASTSTLPASHLQDPVSQLKFLREFRRRSLPSQMSGGVPTTEEELLSLRMDRQRLERQLSLLSAAAPPSADITRNLLRQSLRGPSTAHSTGAGLSTEHLKQLLR